MPRALTASGTTLRNLCRAHHRGQSQLPQASEDRRPLAFDSFEYLAHQKIRTPNLLIRSWKDRNQLNL